MWASRNARSARDSEGWSIIAVERLIQRRGHRWSADRAWLLVVGLLAAGCGTASATPPPEPAISPLVTNEPTAAPEESAPAGTLVPVDEAMFSEDMRRLQLS